MNAMRNIITMHMLLVCFVLSSCRVDTIADGLFYETST